MIKDSIEIVWPVKGGPDGADARTRFLHAKSCLLTWQGPWGVLSVPDRELVGLPVDDLVAILEQRADLKLIWNEFQAFVKALAESHFVRDWSCSFEVCTTTFSEKHEVRVHGHAFLARDDARICIDSYASTVWRGGVAVKSLGKGPKSLMRCGASWCGCYYL